MNSAWLEKFQAGKQKQIPARFKNLAAGWRVIGGKRIYFRSRWEANIGHYLQFLFEQGEIKEWSHEPETFWFLKIKRGVRSYLPDFKVVEKTGRTVYMEVKGFWDRQSKTKLKRMKIYYPAVNMRVIDAKWFAANGKKMGRIVPNWEHESIKL